MTLHAVFTRNQNEVTTGELFQWDTGQQLCIEGLTDIDENTKVHFANNRMSQAIVKTGTFEDNALTVDIPNEFLQSGGVIHGKAWVYVTESETVGQTIKTINIPIVPRTRPNDYVSPADPDSKGIVEQALEILRDGTKVSYVTSATVDNATETGKVYYTTVGSSKALIVPVSGESSQAQFRLDRDGKIYARRREKRNGAFPEWGSFADIAAGVDPEVVCQIVEQIVEAYIAEHGIDLTGVERTANKVTTIGSNPTDTQYPSALAVKKAIDAANPYVFVTEIPADADHSKKYVLPDGYIWEWREDSQTIEYDANRTDYTGEEAWKNRVLNQKPDLANSTNIKVLANEPGVLLSAVIPYGPDWGWNGDDNTINSNTNKTKIEIKGGFGAKLSAMVRPIGSGIGDKAFVIYYYDENGTYLGNLSPKDSQIIRWNSEWVAQNAYYETGVDYDMPVCFKCMDSSLALGAAKYSQVRYVRIVLGISSTGDITESDIADIKIHVPYYDVPGSVSGWTKTAERHPIYTVIDDVFKVSTAQKLYAVGDSITWGYKNTGSGVVQIDSWVKHLIDINGYAPVGASGSKNLGISGIGFCVPTLNFGVNPIYLEDSDIWKTDYSDADIITVGLGINDWRDTTGVATYANLRTKMYNLFNRIRNGDTNTNPSYKGNQVCKIYFILPFNEKTRGTNASDFYSLGWKNTNYPSYCCGKTLMEFVNFLKDTVNSGDFKQFRIQLIDMTECPAINRHNMPTALLDGLHPTEETHAALGKEIARILSLPSSNDGSDNPSKVSELFNDSNYLTLATLPVYNGGVQ